MSNKKFIDSNELLDRAFGCVDEETMCVLEFLVGGSKILNINIEDCSLASTTDVRHVVLCRDCYAYRRDKELAEAAYLDPKMYCGLLRCEMGEDSFCSYGKRKEET